MANEEHLQILKQGVDAWNQWRKENPKIMPDLSRTSLIGTDLRRANLSGANLTEADIGYADFSKANLSGADLHRAYIIRANLSSANLSNANLWCAQLIETNIENAIFTSCSIYGISAWGLKGKPLKQLDLIITPAGEPKITVDNLEVAQFIYLLLYNEKIRHVIDTVTSKVVLILGRFTPGRKVILDAIKKELRKRDYLPVMFDFEKPASRDLTETITTLARLSKFIIVDITDPRSVPHELQAIIPTLAVPVQPLIQGSSKEYGMFSDFKKYPWVLEIRRYDNHKNLLASLEKEVIVPAEAKVKELKKMMDDRR